jgi:formamidopyrimidine-DNA glycosylase
MISRGATWNQPRGGPHGGQARPTGVEPLGVKVYNLEQMKRAGCKERAATGGWVLPELPEVETVVRDLRPLLVGRRIDSTWASRARLRMPWSRAWGPRMVGRRVEEVGRRGKWILLRMDDGQVLVIHLGMTGQLTVIPSNQDRADHTHLVFALDHGGMHLRFRDIRRFGGALLFEHASELDRFFHDSALGPEPFDLDRNYWRGVLARTQRCLKAVLLDQRAVAGVGNIYADESLYEARLPPGQLGCETAPTDAERLRKAVSKVLRYAIEKRGSSIRDYVGGSGLRGGYQDEFRVYGRAGQGCLRCGEVIRRVRLAGRSTHFCPRCQARKRSNP